MDCKKPQIVWGQGATGILRKKDLETDLFVFGYSCKVFRDDAKALEMDQGKQLISWMGNETLKIDRYDARGHLSELSQLEASNQNFVLTPDERRIEQLCDEERYRALYHNEEEQEMYQEEELKRLKQDLGSDKDYNQVSYNYTDTPSNPTSQVEGSSEEVPHEEVDDPFVPSPLLDLPEDMVLPSTAKQNEIIEKTAKACAVHGAQMDIIIKTRQANNPKFNFMYSHSTLYPYYLLLLNQFKSGRYRPTYETKIDTENNEDDEHYLHPNLASSMSVEPAPSIPSIAYKPNPDNAYTKLINKIKAVQLLNLETMEVSPSETPVQSTNTPEITMVAEETYSAPPRRKRKKKNSYRPRNGLEQTSKPQEPPEHIKQIIMKVIINAINRGRHPFKLGAKLHSMGVECVKDFALPCTKYFKYYERLLNMEPYSQRLLSMKHKEFDNESPKTSAASPTYSDNFQFSDGDESDLSDIIEKLDEPLNESIMPQNKCTQPPQTKVSMKDTSKNKPAPVCFSIKKPREAEKLEHVSALPIEESSTEGEGEEEKEPLPKTIETGKLAVITKDDVVKNDKTLKISPSTKTREKGRSKRPEEAVNGSTSVNSTSNSSRRSRSSSKSHHDKRDTGKHKKSRHKSNKAPNPSSSNYSSHASKEYSTSRGHKKSHTIKNHKKRIQDKTEYKTVQEIKKKNCENSINEDDDDVVKDSFLILEQNITNNSTTINDADEQRKQKERKLKVQQLLSALKNNSVNSDKSNTHQQETQILSTTESGSGTVTPFDKNDEPPSKKVKSNEEDFRKKVKSSLQGYLAMISRSSTPDGSELPPVSPLPPPPLEALPSFDTHSPEPIKSSEVKLSDSGKLVVPEPKTAPRPILNSPEQDDDVIFVSENYKPNSKLLSSQVDRSLEQPVTINIDLDSNSDTSSASPHSQSFSKFASHSSYKKKHNKKRKRKHSNYKKQHSSENSASSDEESSSSSSSSDYESEVDVKSKKKHSDKKKRKMQHRSPKSKIPHHHKKRHRQKSTSSSDEETSSNSSSSSDDSDETSKRKKKRSGKKKHSKSHKSTRPTKLKKSLLSKKHHYHKKKSRKRHSSSDF